MFYFNTHVMYVGVFYIPSDGRGFVDTILGVLARGLMSIISRALKARCVIMRA